MRDWSRERERDGEAIGGASIPGWTGAPEEIRKAMHMYRGELPYLFWSRQTAHALALAINCFPYFPLSYRVCLRTITSLVASASVYGPLSYSAEQQTVYQNRNNIQQISSKSRIARNSSYSSYIL